MKWLTKVVCSSLVMLPLVTLAEEAPVVDVTSSGVDVNNTELNAPAPVVAGVNAVPVSGISNKAFAADSVAPASASTPPTPEQVAQQVNYLQQLNLPQQIQQLQQQIQDMKGIIDTQGHQIEQLQNQLVSQYSDLNNRVAPKNADKDAITVSSTTAAAAPLNAMEKQSSATALKKTSALTPSASAPLATGNGAASAADNTLATKAAPLKETQAYEVAFGQIKNKKYSEAIQSLNDYLKQFPSGQYIANAHYWLGELYAISGESDKAESELTLVTTQFPTSDKAANSMLKLGNMAYDQHNVFLAKEWWGKINKKFPNSSAARIANAKLLQMEKAGQ